MNENTSTVLIFALLILAIFLFAGEPDITDSINELIQRMAKD